jgi:hypothetical protein
MHALVHVWAVDGVPNHQAGVVHQDLQVSDRLLYLGRHSPAGVGIRDVEGQGPDLGAVGHDRRTRLGAGFDLDVRDDDTRPALA